MASTANAFELRLPLSGAPEPRIRMTPPPRLVVQQDATFVLADSAMRSLLDEFLSRHGNRVQLTRVVLEDVDGDGAATPETHVCVEGMVLKPVEGGYERIDLSFGWSQRIGLSVGSTTCRVPAAPKGPFFAIDLGLCLTIERIIATLKYKGRVPKRFHRIAFGFTEKYQDHPVWSLEFTRGRLFGPRREGAIVDDITGETELSLL
jgi:hypothetical protein